MLNEVIQQPNRNHKVSSDLAMGRVWIYLAALLVGVALIVVFPWLSTDFL
jgi:hypothetical protein